MNEYPSIESLDADINLLKEELRRLKRLRKELTKPAIPVTLLLSQVGPAKFDPVITEIQEIFLGSRTPRPPRKDLVGPRKPRAPYLGMKVAELPSVLTEEQFREYLLHKQELNPTNNFWFDEQQVRQWLQSKGKERKSNEQIDLHY
jgi:archaellum component FlaC